MKNSNTNKCLLGLPSQNKDQPMDITALSQNKDLDISSTLEYLELELPKNSIKIFEPSACTYGRLLGTGPFHSVYEGTCLIDNQVHPVALKVGPKRHLIYLRSYLML